MTSNDIDLKIHCCGRPGGAVRFALVCLQRNDKLVAQLITQVFQQGVRRRIAVVKHKSNRFAAPAVFLRKHIFGSTQKNPPVFIRLLRAGSVEGTDQIVLNLDLLVCGGVRVGIFHRILMRCCVIDSLPNLGISINDAVVDVKVSGRHVAPQDYIVARSLVNRAGRLRLHLENLIHGSPHKLIVFFFDPAAGIPLIRTILRTHGRLILAHLNS